jgi:trk system potassium uptake protein TrkA
MNVLIFGAGQVGFGVAQRMKNLGMSVTLVEKYPKLPYMDCLSGVDVVHGDALDINVLKSINPEGFSYLIATMSYDEQNIIACHLAGSIFKIRTKIARIKSKTFLKDDTSELFLKNNFSIDGLTHPEWEVAAQVSDIASLNGAFDVIHLNRIVIVGLRSRENTEVVNTPFRHFQNVTNLIFFVLTITRDEVTFFPTGQDILLPNDQIYIAIDFSHLNEIMDLFGYPQKKESLLVVGGGSIGAFAVKRMIGKQDFSITWLEKSRKMAEKIAQDYPTASVILGDVLDRELLREIGNEITVAIVATDRDEINALSSMFLKQLPVERVITLIENQNYNTLLPEKQGFCVINPGTVTVEAILQKFIPRRILSVFPLKNSPACVVEVEVTEACSMLNEPMATLLDLAAPALILRKDQVMLAKKETLLQLGDTVTLQTTSEKVDLLGKMFRVSSSF